jgi:hypothetical protein
MNTPYQPTVHYRPTTQRLADTAPPPRAATARTGTLHLNPTAAALWRVNPASGKRDLGRVARSR